MTITWSNGGGRQSVAIATLILEGKLPRPDYIVMADTSREVSSTFDYLNTFVKPALNKIGLRVQIVPHRYATVDLYSKRNDILVPAFTRKNGKLGRMPGFCSNEWKQRVIRRWLRDEGVSDTDVWLGISLDEAERMKPSGLNWYRHVYPLIDMVPMHRIQCANQITRYGWPLPNRSRCKMCPNQSASEWRELAPSELKEAMDIERDMRFYDRDAYLHLSGFPLDQAMKLDSLQESLFDGCDGGYCMV